MQPARLMEFSQSPTMTMGRASEPQFAGPFDKAKVLPSYYGCAMPKGYKGPQPLSDLQAFLVSNLRAQTKLKAELTWLGVSPARGRKQAIQGRRIIEITDDLAALSLALAMRRKQEKQRAKGS